MADPTATPNDYSNKSKSELLDLLLVRDRALEVRAGEAKAAYDAAFMAGTEAQKKLAGRAIDDLRDRAERAEQELQRITAKLTAADVDREQAKAARAAKGPGKLLGRVDVFENDSPEDVVERAHVVRLGGIPVARAKRFKTDAWIRVGFETKLAQRLDPTIVDRLKKKPDLVGQVEVPLHTQFTRDELPAAEIDHLYAQGAIVAIA